MKRPHFSPDTGSVLGAHFFWVRLARKHEQWWMVNGSGGNVSRLEELPDEFKLRLLFAKPWNQNKEDGDYVTSSGEYMLRVTPEQWATVKRALA